MLDSLKSQLTPLFEFIKSPTPEAWINHAVADLPLLLIDHAHCERKAAATAINFISKYPERSELVAVMSPLAREEMLHFEKVIQLMKQRGIDFCPLKPSGYAQNMHRHVTVKNGIERLSDQLIIGAIIEARSCERFYRLIPALEDAQLAKFYESLVKSEARHFEDYLRLAKLYGGEIQQRIDFFVRLENESIHAEEDCFRFHSGIPLVC